MVRQSESVFKRKFNIALVTDSTCDLDEEIIDNYQIHVLPVNISFGENHYLDKITLKAEKFYELLGESPVHPKSHLRSTKRHLLTSILTSLHIMIQL